MKDNISTEFLPRSRDMRIEAAADAVYGQLFRVASDWNCAAQEIIAGIVEKHAEEVIDHIRPSAENVQVAHKVCQSGHNLLQRCKAEGTWLATGVYINPHTGEVVEKIKREPNIIVGWVVEYGIHEVASWRQPDT